MRFFAVPKRPYQFDGGAAMTDATDNDDEAAFLNRLGVALNAQAISRARRAAQRAGFQVNVIGGRFTLTRAGGVEVQGLTARDVLRWLRDFG